VITPDTLITAEDCLGRPDWVLERLQRDCSYVGSATATDADDGVVFVVELLPLRDLEPHGFEPETVRVLVRDDEQVFALVPTDGRKWKHTYDGFYFCLWFPDDPPQLKWDWSKGFATYLWILDRHVLYEEQWRRSGEWPVEDAPHGRGTTRHEIRTPRLRAIAGEGLQL
jgi:hypothetical protein